MKRSSLSRQLSAVQVLGATALIVFTVLTFPAAAPAEGNQMSCGPNERVKERIVGENGKISVICETDEDKAEDQYAACRDLRTQTDQAEQDMTKSCTEAGMKGSDCIRTVIKCIEEDRKAPKEDSNSGVSMETVNQLLGAAGMGFQMPTTNALQNDKRCSNMASRDYFDEKDRIERDLKDLDRENGDLQKELAEEKEKVDEQFKDANEKVAQSKNELAEKKLKATKDQRDELSSLRQQQSDAAQNVRALNKKMTETRLQMAQYEIEHGKKFAAKTAELDQLACLVAVKDLRDQLVKAGVYNLKGSSGVSWAAQADQRKKELQARFDSCIREKNIERLALIQERESAMKLMKENLSSLQADIDQANTSMSSTTENMEQTIKDTEQSITNAQNATLQEMQNANSSMQAAQTTLQQKQAALAQKQQSLVDRRTRLNKDLVNLGPEPNRGAKVGWYEASRGVETFKSRLDNFKSKCCGLKERKDNSKALYEGRDRYCPKKGKLSSDPLASDMLEYEKVQKSGSGRK